MKSKDCFRLTEVARAIGTTPKQIRNWLTRDVIALDANKSRNPGSWRSFIFLDVVRMALVKELARFGVPLKSASEIVEGLIDATDGYSLWAEGNDAALDMFGHMTLYVWADKGAWEWAIRQPSVQGTMIYLPLRHILNRITRRYI